MPAPAGLPAGRRGRPATRPARCSCWTRSRAASAGPARGSRYQAEGVMPDVHHAGQGSGRRAADRRVHRPRGRPAPALGRGEHGSTFGGNPVACAAALAVLDTIERDGLLANVTQVGARAAAGIEALGHPLVTGVRGSGLWLAIALDRAGGRCGGDGGAAGRVPGQRGPAGRDPARAAAGAHASQARSFTDALPGILAGRRAIGRTRWRASSERRPAGTSTRRPERGWRAGPALPARRRPHPGRAGRGPRRWPAR